MEPETLSTQESTVRMFKAGSLPNLLPLPPKEFLKTYHLLKQTQSGTMQSMQLNQLKHARIQSVDGGEFKKAICHLRDVATLPKFRKEYVELQPMAPTSGFMEAGETQHFLIVLAGSKSPLHIDVHREKGDVTCYFSFTSSKPGPKLHDFSFKCRIFRVFSQHQYSYFKDSTVYLSVFAEQDTVVTLRISFGRLNPIELENHMRISRASLYRSLQAEYVPKPSLLGNLLKKAGATLTNFKPAKELSHSFDFVKANKILNKDISYEEKKKTNANRQQQVRIRRAQLAESIKMKAEESIEKFQRRAAGVQEALYISAVLERKQRFERDWLKLITFARLSQLLYVRFVTIRLGTVRILQRSMVSQRFQRLYKQSFHSDFPIQSRQMALGKHHLMLWMRVTMHHRRDVLHAQMMDCMRISLNQGMVVSAATHTLASIVRIQRIWRQKKALEQVFFRYLLETWDAVVAEEEARRALSGDKAKRFIPLNASQRVSIIFQEMQKAKKRYRDFLSGPVRHSAHLVSFLPKASDLRKVLLKRIKASRRRLSKS